MAMSNKRFNRLRPDIGAKCGGVGSRVQNFVQASWNNPTSSCMSVEAKAFDRGNLWMIDQSPLLGYLALALAAELSLTPIAQAEAEACGNPSPPSSLLLSTVQRFKLASYYCHLNATRCPPIDADGPSTFPLCAQRREYPALLSGT